MPRSTPIAATAGKGSAAARSAQLRALFEQRTAAEQDFLLRLLVGELRQGALEGMMIDAIAAAAGVPVADVRRAAMIAGSLGAVARVALTEGAAGAGALRHRAASAGAADARAAGRRHRAARGAAAARRRSNGRSTARACRCTRRATRSRSTRAT